MTIARANGAIVDRPEGRVRPLLVCIRVNTPGLRVPAGAQKRRCVYCEAEVWVSKSGLQIEWRTVICCGPCAIAVQVA